jgi:hypothetical protein
MSTIVNVDGIKYRLQSNDTAIVTENRHLSRTDVVIPATISHENMTYPVVAVGQNAFHLNQHITSVTFASDCRVLSFGPRAFQNTKISTLEIPSTVNAIHEDTFRHTPFLVKIILNGGENSFVLDSGILYTKDRTTLLFVPRNYTKDRTNSFAIAPPVTTVGPYAFEGCSRLECITIAPKGCVCSVIGAGAFAGTSITKFIVPSTVTSLGEGFLRKCKVLKSVVFCRSTAEYAIPPFAFAETGLTEIEIPQNITMIAARAFSQTYQLKSVQFAPDSKLTSIQADVFWSSGIESLSIPDSLQQFVPANFFACENLVTINISEGNPNYVWKRDVLWGNQETQILFAKRTIEAFHIPKKVKVIGAYAFGLCRKLKAVTFEDESELTLIDTHAFFGTALTEIAIPDKVSKIGENAFGNCVSLANVSFGIGSELVELGRRAFGLTGIRRFNGPSRLAKIGASVFANSKVEKVVLPEKIQTLPSHLFFSCKSLVYVVSDNPKTLTASDLAFEGVSKTPSIYRTDSGEFRVNTSNRKEGRGLDQFQVCVGRPADLFDGTGYEKAPMRPRQLSDALVEDERVPVPGWEVKTGTFAKVYKAQHPGTQKISAVKELRTKPQKLESFTQEIEVLLQVFHPAIIGLIGAVLPGHKTNGQIITEFMPNGSLHEQLQTEDYANQSSTVKVKIAVGVAAAMRYMHKHTIIHRDLKPMNILLDENFEPRVADFGSARDLDATMSMTTQNGVGLTPLYMAPEFFDGAKYSEMTDMYSYAITLWEILTGRSMGAHIRATTDVLPDVVLLNRIRDGRLRPPTSGSDINLQQWVVELLQCCWSGNPADRLSFEGILTKFREKEFALLPDVDFPAVEEYLTKLEEFEAAQLHRLN